MYDLVYPYRSVYPYPGFMGAVPAADRQVWKTYINDLQALEGQLKKGVLPPDTAEPPRPTIAGTKLQMQQADAIVRRLPTARVISKNLYDAAAARSETGLYSRGLVPPPIFQMPQPAPMPQLIQQPGMAVPAPSAGPVPTIPGVAPIPRPPEPIQPIEILPATSRGGLIAAGVGVAALLGLWAFVRKRRKNPCRNPRRRRRRGRPARGR